MKLKYVSVIRRYLIKDKKWCSIVRGELEFKPPALWLKYFQLFWMSTSTLKDICLEPQVDSTGIMLFLCNDNQISMAIHALKKVVSHLEDKRIHQ